MILSLRAPHDPCRHGFYALTCDELDALRQRSAGRCEICEVKERYAAGGLHIDHDHDLGVWAVRGLLCGRCNTMLGRGILVGEEVDAYLARPWRTTPPSGLGPPETASAPVRIPQDCRPGTRPLAGIKVTPRGYIVAFDERGDMITIAAYSPDGICAFNRFMCQRYGDWHPDDLDAWLRHVGR